MRAFGLIDSLERQAASELSQVQDREHPGECGFKSRRLQGYTVEEHCQHARYRSKHVLHVGSEPDISRKRIGFGRSNLVVSMWGEMVIPRDIGARRHRFESGCSQLVSVVSTDIKFCSECWNTYTALPRSQRGQGQREQCPTLRCSHLTLTAAIDVSQVKSP